MTNNSSSSSSLQIPNSASLKSLSFDDISKLFSLPLSDAATNLGVCTSVLKKICRDNGLVRWPYRQFLSGKSIEDIKKDAARERNKQRAEFLKAASHTSGGSASSAVSSSLLRGVTMPHIMQQQQGNKNIQNGQPQNSLNTMISGKGISASLDEFKYGFPSDGLSTVSYKWWEGSSSSSSHDGYGRFVGGRIETDESEELAKGDTKPESRKEKSSIIGPQGTGLLMDVRKRAVEEGQEALKRQKILLI